LIAWPTRSFEPGRLFARRSYVAGKQGIRVEAGYPMGDVASTPFQPDETLLIAGLRAGSEEAFALLVMRFYQPVYSLLVRTMHQHGNAADLTQEVFVKLSRGVRNIHGQSSLRTWIYRVALREAANRRRWWMRHKQMVPNESELCGEQCGTPMLLKDTLVNQTEAPYEIAVHMQTHARVERALRKVPEPFRTTLILRDIEGFPYEEVAEMQTVTLETVKSHLVRGRACLKELLAVPAAHFRCMESPGFEMRLGKDQILPNRQWLRGKTPAEERTASF